MESEVIVAQANDGSLRVFAGTYRRQAALRWARSYVFGPGRHKDQERKQHYGTQAVTELAHHRQLRISWGDLWVTISREQVYYDGHMVS